MGEGKNTQPQRGWGGLKFDTQGSRGGDPWAGGRYRFAVLDQLPKISRRKSYGHGIKENSYLERADRQARDR
jgi:hypothetical protein